MRPGTGPPTLLVLVVSPTDTGAQAAHEVGHQLHYCEVAHQHSVEEMLAFVATRPDAVVPLMMVSDEVGSLDVLAGRLQDRPALRTTRLLLTRRDELTHLGRALDEDWVHEVVSVPWTPGALGHRAGAHVTRWLRETLPDDPRLAHLDADTPPDLPQASLLSKFAGDDDELVAELVAACERVLGPRPRLHLPRGVRVTREGMPVDAVYILEHGTVALTRVTRAGKVTLHHATTGRIIGILSLASQGSAFVTATTTSEVELILLSVEQLDRALRGDPMTGEAPPWTPSAHAWRRSGPGSPRPLTPWSRPAWSSWRRSGSRRWASWRRAWPTSSTTRWPPWSGRARTRGRRWQPSWPSTPVGTSRVPPWSGPGTCLPAPRRTSGPCAVAWRRL